MKILIKFLLGLTILAAAACVTINIYFPAEELRGAADQIVHEVWGERSAPAPPPQTVPGERGSFLYRLPAVGVAHASQDINVSTPEIRAVKESMKQRSERLFPYLDSGHVGIGADGLLKVRSTEGLDLRTRGEVNRLVGEENSDRQRLYREIARANGFPDRVQEVQSIFADSWRDNADPGWYLEQADGSWRAK
ncbi:YdbL family protein [Geoalkalibacter halelectricus]|uniref:YdbL family protein n=1 Tax=Geoalkalibacter halelectricus TaxID=2847045 RepID=A0ABY5ZME0_9BACT|nr:YdbL family protein [Geoalkalibacter halelectricus]MDO3378907.1 YdbL family protein [Geoalkalibacter halelectricus]UWZ79070.1 YdbL family protein [Geoalkalibacter halelectricus]